jgi:hypothetical protein
MALDGKGPHIPIASDPFIPTLTPEITQVRHGSILDHGTTDFRGCLTAILGLLAWSIKTVLIPVQFWTLVMLLITTILWYGYMVIKEFIPLALLAWADYSKGPGLRKLYELEIRRRSLEYEFYP